MKLGLEKCLCSAEAHPASPWQRLACSGQQSDATNNPKECLLSWVLPSQASPPQTAGSPSSHCSSPPSVEPPPPAEAASFAFAPPTKRENSCRNRKAHLVRERPLPSGQCLSSARSRDTCAFPALRVLPLPPQAEQKAKAGGKYGSPGCKENECREHKVS